MEERTRDTDPETGYKVDSTFVLFSLWMWFSLKPHLAGFPRNVSECSVRTTRDVSLLRR